MDVEVTQIRKALAQISPSIELCEIVVQKRIHTRIFQTNEQRQVLNPLPGTVIDTGCVSADSYDFYCISQHVTQGNYSYFFVCKRNLN